jgi:hypothetical protein
VVLLVFGAATLPLSVGVKLDHVICTPWSVRSLAWLTVTTGCCEMLCHVHGFQAVPPP